jgi:hypothetical protein
MTPSRIWIKPDTTLPGVGTWTAENTGSAAMEGAVEYVPAALAWRLRGYAVHDDDCTINRHPHYRACSCGLNAAKARMEETPHD